MSLHPQLLGKFDETCRRAGIADRSRALQMAMRYFIAENEVAGKEHEQVSGAILLVYSTTVRGLEKALTKVQHVNRHLVASTLHNHLDAKRCLEAVTVHGDAVAIERLSQSLRRQRGVKYVKKIVFPAAMD